jgi:hypothetical protein
VPTGMPPTIAEMVVLFATSNVAARWKPLPWMS